MQRASALALSLGIAYNALVKPLRPHDLPNPLDGLVRVFNVEIERTWNGRQAKVCTVTARDELRDHEIALLSAAEGVDFDALLQQSYEAAGWAVVRSVGCWHFAHRPPPPKPRRDRY